MKISIFTVCFVAVVLGARPFNAHDNENSIQGLRSSRTENLQNETTVSYYVWYDPDPLSSNALIRKFTTSSKPNTKLWDIMKIASRKDTGFKFRYIKFPIGRYVTSIGGVREDNSQNLHWMMYKLREKPDPRHPPNKTHVIPLAVDKIRVQPNDVYLFWRNHATH